MKQGYGSKNRCMNSAAPARYNTRRDGAKIVCGRAPGRRDDEEVFCDMMGIDGLVMYLLRIILIVSHASPLRTARCKVRSPASFRLAMKAAKSTVPPWSAAGNLAKPWQKRCVCGTGAAKWAAGVYRVGAGG